MIKNTVKRVLGVAAAALIATAGTAALTATDAHAAGDGRITAKPSLAVRYAPTTQSSKVGSLKHGETVSLACRVTGSSVDGNRTWYKVIGDSPEWIAGRYVDAGGQPPNWCGNNERFLARATAPVNLRTGPNTDNRSVRTLSRGEEVNLVCEAWGESIDGNRKWYWTEDHNWVSAKYIQNVLGSPYGCVDMTWD